MRSTSTFAAAARGHAGNPAAHTDLACKVLTGLSSHRAAELTDAAARSLRENGVAPSYEVWRRRLRTALADTAGWPAQSRGLQA